MSAATAYSKNNGFHKSSKTPWGNPVVYFFSLVLVAICVVPVLYIIFGGFRTNAQITNNPAGLPNPWVISNYKEVITSDIFWTELVNSLIVGICTMVGVVVLGIMVSYVIARYRFRYSTLMYALFSAGLMFPMTVGITPLYLMIRNLGLSNSLAGIILPQIAFGLPQTIIILVPFLQSIPMELEEACLLDGCSRLGFFWRMVIPLSMPGVATTGILTFVGSWTDRIRSAADHHHPGPIPAIHTDGVGGGVPAGRLLSPRLLLAHGHPAFDARRRHDRYPHLRGKLERLYASALRPER